MPTEREAQLLAQLEARDVRLVALEKENELLRQKIDLLVKMIFGAKSENVDSAQLLLLLQGLSEPPGKVPEPVVAEAPRRSAVPLPPRERRPRLPEQGRGAAVVAGLGCPVSTGSVSQAGADDQGASCGRPRLHGNAPDQCRD